MQHQQHLQINVGHLKTEMVKKLGAERSKLYFFYLNRFLSLKITKVEFNKICFRVLGRENIVLHNQLITSILRNAYHANAPPEIHGAEVCKPSDAADESGGYNIPAPSDELQQTNTCKDQAHTFNSSLLSNGSISQPPFRARSGSHERTRGADLLSSHSKGIADLSYISVLENGSANHSTIGNLTQDEQSHVCSGSKIASAGDWTGASIRSRLQPPLGVPLSAASTGGARSAAGCVSSYDCGGLLDSVTLKRHMEQIAMNQGLRGVSLDCANLLNNALDSYLKSLIRSSVAMGGKGSGSDAHLNMTDKGPLHSSLDIRFLSSNQSRILSSSRPMDGVLQEQRPMKEISLLDFRVAMELKPQQLGEDWPLLLEKMSAHSHMD